MRPRRSGCCARYAISYLFEMARTIGQLRARHPERMALAPFRGVMPFGVNSPTGAHSGLAFLETDQIDPS
jgi:hypothetical protein